MAVKTELCFILYLYLELSSGVRHAQFSSRRFAMCLIKLRTAPASWSSFSYCSNFAHNFGITRFQPTLSLKLQLSPHSCSLSIADMERTLVLRISPSPAAHSSGTTVLPGILFRAMVSGTVIIIEYVKLFFSSAIRKPPCIYILGLFLPLISCLKLWSIFSSRFFADEKYDLMFCGNYGESRRNIVADQRIRFFAVRFLAVHAFSRFKPKYRRIFIICRELTPGYERFFPKLLIR